MSASARGYAKALARTARGTAGRAAPLAAPAGMRMEGELLSVPRPPGICVCLRTRAAMLRHGRSLAAGGLAAPLSHGSPLWVAAGGGCGAVAEHPGVARALSGPGSHLKKGGKGVLGPRCPAVWHRSLVHENRSDPSC